MFPQNVTKREYINNKKKRAQNRTLGTPVVTVDVLDLKRFNWIHWVRPERYDLNQDRGVPVIPIETNLSRSISCETVSKAAVKSRRTSMVKSPESAANNRSLVILIRAVSVLWWGRKPDWNCSYKLLLERCSWIWIAIHFSIILEINGKFEIGRKWSKLNGSDSDFLSMGVILADLKNDGTEPETSEAWTILVINGNKAGKHAFTKGVGRGSNWQVEDLNLFIRPTISEAVGSVKVEKTEWEVRKR